MGDVFEVKTGHRIHAYIKENDLKYAGIAKKLDISRSYFYNMLMGTNTLTQEYLDKINEVLKTDFKL